ncbi:hypothetical protein GGX14DRAFT_402266 [Mycena pura]|uniref:Uncharacterized protein n=1 Tax=Mycena pura TaxID=153505 RepID=A0AAD6V5Q0_9AGAR|nr:hypothetical protein GGX14DRAFT_402266 [Mycena pura]
MSDCWVLSSAGAACPVVLPRRFELNRFSVANNLKGRVITWVAPGQLLWHLPYFVQFDPIGRGLRPVQEDLVAPNLDGEDILCCTATATANPRHSQRSARFTHTGASSAWAHSALVPPKQSVCSGLRAMKDGCRGISAAFEASDGRVRDNVSSCAPHCKHSWRPPPLVSVDIIARAMGSAGACGPVQRPRLQRPSPRGHGHRTTADLTRAHVSKLCHGAVVVAAARHVVRRARYMSAEHVHLQCVWRARAERGGRWLCPRWRAQRA